MIIKVGGRLEPLGPIGVYAYNPIPIFSQPAIPESLRFQPGSSNETVKKCVTHYYYSVNNVPLSHVDKGRDLCIIVDSSLKFDKHISLIVHKTMNRSRLILKCFHSRDRVLLTIAFCTYVRPILEYCSAVWSPYFKYLITKIEHVCSEIFYKRPKGCWKMPYEQRLNTLYWNL